MRNTKKQLVVIIGLFMLVWSGCSRHIKDQIKQEPNLPSEPEDFSITANENNDEPLEDHEGEDPAVSWYLLGETEEKNGNIGAAAIAFGKAGNYLDADKRSKELWNSILDRKFISAVGTTTFMISQDGALVSSRYPQSLSVEETKELGDIISISGYLFLRSDGTVFSMSSNGPKNVEGWTDIVDISYNCGLKKDGTVVETRIGGQEAAGAEKFKDVISVSGPYGLHADGTVFYRGWSGNHYPYWEDLHDIIAIAGSDTNFAALREDGKVLAYGFDFENVPREGYWVIGWDSIIDIEMAPDHLVALKSDGTVAAIGDNTYGQCNVEDWTDIVSISCGYYHTVGVKFDGTVIATGASQCPPDSSELVYFGQCEVDGWVAKLPVSKDSLIRRIQHENK